MSGFQEDFSFLYAKEECKLSRGLSAFRRMFEALDDSQQVRFVAHLDNLVDLTDQQETQFPNVATTMHVVESERGGEPKDFEIPPKILQLALEKWINGDLFVPDGFDLRNEVGLHPSYGARAGL